MSSALVGCALTAIQKGGGVRPIAMVYVWTRLAGKVECRLLSGRASWLLDPWQLGFGVPEGAEVAVHDDLEMGHTLVAYS